MKDGDTLFGLPVHEMEMVELVGGPLDGEQREVRVGLRSIRFLKVVDGELGAMEYHRSSKKPSEFHF